MDSKRCIVITVIVAMLSWAPAAIAGEPLSLNSLLGPQANTVLMNTVPAAIDLAHKACQATARICGIDPVKVSDLPASVQAELKAVIPRDVLNHARLYFGMPLNDPSMGIGFLNSLGMIAAGGGTVMGMTFGDDVYLAGTRTSLNKSAERRSVLAHELVHVAQYQALGYRAYKELYASETAKGESYENNALERDAFLFQRHFPKGDSMAFFAFLHPRNVVPHVQVKTAGRARLVPANKLQGLQTAEVNITAAPEALPRTATLVLGGAAGVTPQILDPEGHRPLYVFNLRGPARLLYNGRAGAGGPHLVALAIGTGVDVVWRTLDRFHSQRFGPKARIQRLGKGRVRIVETSASGVVRATWRWNGQHFQRN